MRGDESTKERLLAAARDHYLEVGPERFSLREVARRCELTPAAVYRHFDGKEALLAAICEEGFRVFGSYLFASLEVRDPLERMERAGQQYLRFALERPRDYRVMFMADPSGLVAGAVPAPGASFEFLVDRVRECIDAGVFTARDPRETALTIWAHVHGLSSLWVSGQLRSTLSEDELRSVFGRSVDTLLSGLRS